MLTKLFSCCTSRNKSSPSPSSEKQSGNTTAMSSTLVLESVPVAVTQPTATKSPMSISIVEDLKTKPSATPATMTAASYPSPPPEAQSTFTQRALLINSERKYELSETFEVPAALADHEVKIRTCAVGLNQIDYKSVDYNFCLPQLPWITGREMAGVVEEVGAGVQNLKEGQRVWTSTYYRDRRAGCFQASVIVPQHTVCPIVSDTLPFTDAACLGVCGLTAAMTLWRWFGVEMPYTVTDESPLSAPATPSQQAAGNAPCMLIWGGSSVTGQFLVQLAKRSGLSVVTVSSAATGPLLLSLGADRVVARDGKTNEEIVEEIKSLPDCEITMGVDLVGAKTALATLSCLSTTSPSRFAPLAWAPKVELPAGVEMLNVEMKQFVLDPSSEVYAVQLSRLVEQGEIRLPEIEVLPGGLDVVEQGLERLKKGDMGGKKLVVDMLR